MSPTTDRIRSQGFALVESEIPAEMTISQYRAQRAPQVAPTRWERARTGILGVSVVGIAAEILMLRRSVR